MPRSSISAGPSGGSAQDAGARNLALVVFLLVGGLICFLLYLVWKSFTAAAPPVLWSSVSPHRDPLLYQSTEGYQPEVAGSIAQADQQTKRAGQSAADSGEENEASSGEEGEDEESQRPFGNPAIIHRGQRLYRKAGCAMCHGREGKGGVTNPNYQKDTFPSLEPMAARLGLEFPEDVEVVGNMLAAGQSLDDPSRIDVPDGAGIISARYQTVSNVILNGNPAMPKDESGTPPIEMPSYKDTLTKAEMNQLLASVLALYPIEEEEWEEDAEQ
ncbi:MAG: cytochrome c [Pirellulaceae bacterium]